MKIFLFLHLINVIFCLIGRSDEMVSVIGGERIKGGAENYFLPVSVYLLILQHSKFLLIIWWIVDVYGERNCQYVVKSRTN